eukprot:TRINITY_DN5905_c1_g1_i2.p1 TRINITY_DN5905_c1_g1~~TRINITY_DN5905_c1_g1_i2.p1  ORF type:complete len:1238 (+),score=215.15 TRINITY_DN5905_c1_g1_i2:156-3869(+)
MSSASTLARFQSLLEPELKLLGQEAKKRHAPLKDACERAIARMGTIAEESLEGEALLRSMEETWRPLLIACDCKSPRLVSIAAGALQRLLSHRLILQSSVAPIITALSKLTEIDEGVQLKVLQCLMALFSNSTDYNLTSTQVPIVLTLAFSMHNPKNSLVVQSTAVATLNQITMSIFDRLPAASDAGASDRFTEAKSAYLLFKDLCLMISGEPSQFVKVSDIPRVFLLELLYMIVNEHSDVISEIPQFITLIREDLSLALAHIQSVQGAADVPNIIRIYRIVTVTLQKFPHELLRQQELFLNLMFRAMDNSETSVCNKLAILNCWKELGENYFYLKKLYTKFDHSSEAGRCNLFANLVSAMCNVIQKAPPTVLASLSAATERVSWHKLLAIRGDEDNPVKSAEPIIVAIDAIVSVCKSLSKLIEVENRPLTSDELANKVEKQTESLSANMIRSIWRPILSACSLLLDKCINEELIEQTLCCCKQFTHACGKAGLTEAQDAFIFAMNDLSLIQPGTTSLTPKNGQILRVLFDIANGLGGSGVLDSSWFVLLQNFQQLDTVLLNNQAMIESTQTDVALIKTLLSKIFEGTRYFEPNALLSIVQALCKLSAESNKSPETALVQILTPGSPSQRQGMLSTFALQRIADVTDANIFRIDLFWDLIFTHLSEMVTSSTDESIRKASVDTATHIILLYLQVYRTYTTDTSLKDSSAECPSESFFQLQPKVIDILRVMRGCGKSDVRVGCLNLIFTIMQRAGQELTPASWRLILGILSVSSEVGTEVAVGFKSVVLICSDFMPILDGEALQSLISCVGQYSQQTAVPDKTNTNLSAIQQTLSIADYCSSHPQDATPSHWNSLFIQLREAATDARPEVRHSSLKTLFTALITHGCGLPVPCWNTLFWDVLLKVLDAIHSSALAAEQQTSQDPASQKGFIMHHSRNTAAKQWYETRCIVLDGVARLIRVYYKATKSSVSRFNQVLKRLAVHLASASLHVSEEVAIVGIKSLHSLVTDVCLENSEENDLSENTDVLTHDMWVTWQRISECQTTPTPVVTSMVEGLCEMFVVSSKGADSPLRKFLFDSREKILPILDRVMRLPAASDTLTFPSKIQTAVFTTLQTLPSFSPSDVALHTNVIRLICGFLPSLGLVNSCLKDPSLLNTFPPGQLQLTEKLLTLLKESYTSSETPEGVKRDAFIDLVKKLQPILLSRYFSTPGQQFWTCAVPMVSDVMQAGLATFQPNNEGV